MRLIFLGSFAAIGILGHVLKPVLVWWAQPPSACLRRIAGTVGTGAKHYWPGSLGHAGAYTFSPVAGPKKLEQAIAWNWSSPQGRFQTPGIGGSVIDAEKNVYVAANHETLKLSPEGKVLWETPVKPHCSYPQGQYTIQMNSPSLWGDAVIGSVDTGSVFALSMATGQELWSTQIYKDGIPSGCVNNGFIQVGEGVVVADSFFKVHGLNVTDGSPLWEFQLDMPAWNFLATFPLDGTVVFQDFEGKAYRLNLTDGSLLWKAGGTPGTWTDGSAVVGPNDLVYAVGNYFGIGQKKSGTFAGYVAAYRLSDGKVVWKREVDRQPNNVPAVGHLGQGHRLSLVLPIGSQDDRGAEYQVLALDAETGQQQWIFRGPTQVGKHQAMRDIPPEWQERIKPNCIPNPWSAPTIDSTGIVYVANQEGPIFALKDLNGDGEVTGDGEVDSFETLRGFCGSEAPSFAPGMMTIASCDTVYAFRWPE